MRNRVGVLLISFVSVSIALFAARVAFADEPVVDFDIASQELGAALNEFALQSGKEILFVEAEIAGKSTPGINGSYVPEEALVLLLANTRLDYSVNELDTVLVGETIDEVSSNSGKPTPKSRSILLAQAAPNRMQPAPSSSPNEESVKAVVVGKVTDARSGANLKGALVTIEETGQSTSTDDHGDFRLVGVAIGRVTLAVSYLGFAGQSAVVDVRGPSISQHFALRGGTEIEEIVVFGARSARAQSLNQERTALNASTVLADDFLGSFTGTTISEALRRAPGIAFQQDPLTGEGTNVIVRGLEPDLNMVTLNGLRLPESTATGRSPDLSNLLTESISKVTISKTLLPSQDSAGTGGLIDIETKSPLDRPHRFASFGAERVMRDGDFGDGYLASGTVSGRFGADERLGISFSAQYREAETRSVAYNIETFAPVLPNLETGAPAGSSAFIDPRMPFPFDAGLTDRYVLNSEESEARVDLSNLSLSGSIAYELGEHTRLRFDAQHFTEKRTDYNTTTRTGLLIGRAPLSVDALGGEIRNVFFWEDAYAPRGIPGLLFGLQRWNSYTPDRKIGTTAFSFDGQTDLDNISFEYAAGYTRGTSKTPISIGYTVSEIDSVTMGFAALPESSLLPEGQNNQVGGRIVSPWGVRTGNGYPGLLLTDDAFARLNDPRNYAFSVLGTTADAIGENERLSGRFSAKYHFNRPYLDYLRIGGFVEKARFRPNLHPTHTRYLPNDTDLSAFGIGFGTSPLSAIGFAEGQGFGGLTREDTQSVLDNLATFASGATPLLRQIDIERDPRFDDRFSRELEFAGFVEGKVHFGKLEVIGGVRVSHVDVRAVDLLAPRFFDEEGVEDLQFAEDFSILFDESVAQTTVLPRVLANYRFDENNILRAGYFTSVARPQISQLAAPRTVTLNLRPQSGPNRDQPLLFFREGNPDLEPAFTHNFDAAFERYDNDGVFKLGLFYKRIDNFIQRNALAAVSSVDGVGPLPDDRRFDLANLPDNLFVSGSRPRNGEGVAEIWGLEVAVERQLTFLPGFWSGFGVLANYTYSDSSRTDVLTWLFSPVEFDDAGNPTAFEQVDIDVDVAFNQQPKHSGTAAITYNRDNIDASLSYTVQARRLVDGVRNFDLDRYDERVSTLDLRAEYYLGLGRGDVRVYFEGLDLLKGSDDPFIETSIGGANGVPKYYTGGRFLGGRSFLFGAVASF